VVDPDWVYCYADPLRTHASATTTAGGAWALQFPGHGVACCSSRLGSALPVLRIIHGSHPVLTGWTQAFRFRLVRLLHGLGAGLLAIARGTRVHSWTGLVSTPDTPGCAVTVTRVGRFGWLSWLRLVLLPVGALHLPLDLHFNATGSLRPGRLITAATTTRLPRLIAVAIC
jgi:hypothetical protein